MGFTSKQKCAPGSGSMMTFETMSTSPPARPNVKSIEQFLALTLIMCQSDLLFKSLLNIMDLACLAFSFAALTV